MNQKKLLLGIAAVLSSLLLLFLFPPGGAPAAAGPSAGEILDRVDDNMFTTTSVIEAEMTITYQDRVTQKAMHIENAGKDNSYAEFLSPQRDKGIKYLRLGGNLWMYHPGVNRVINIAGHQLRQSANGSDLSYEDMMERSKKLNDRYTATLAGTEDRNGRHCYVLDLVAREQGLTYYRMKLWVDAEYYIALREEYYAKTGKLLKFLENSAIQRFGQRYYPTRITVQDVLRNTSSTVMVMKSIRFDVPLGDAAFSKDRLH